MSVNKRAQPQNDKVAILWYFLPLQVTSTSQPNQYYKNLLRLVKLYSIEVMQLLTYAFPDGQIWPYDLFRVEQEYVPYIKMICWYINTAQFFIPTISLQ